MKFLTSLILYIFISIISLDCLSKKDQRIEHEETLIDVLNSRENPKIIGLTSGVVKTSTPRIVDFTNENQTTKTHLDKIAASFNFHKWVREDLEEDNVTKGAFATRAANFHITVIGEQEGYNNTKLKYRVLRSPYFWMSFWYKYEEDKLKTSSNIFSDTFIQSLFAKNYTNRISINSSTDQKSKTNEIKGIKIFVETILELTKEASESQVIPEESKTELRNAVEDLEKGTRATNAIPNFENLILGNLNYCLNKKLEYCNISTTIHLLKGGVFTENGTLKKGVVVTEELRKSAKEAMRNLIILKESINKKMLTQDSTHQKAAQDKNTYIIRMKAVINQLKTAFSPQVDFISLETCEVIVDEENKNGDNDFDPKKADRCYVVTPEEENANVENGSINDFKRKSGTLDSSRNVFLTGAMENFIESLDTVVNNKSRTSRDNNEPITELTTYLSR